MIRAEQHKHDVQHENECDEGSNHMDRVCGGVGSVRTTISFSLVLEGRFLALLIRPALVLLRTRHVLGRLRRLVI